MLFLKDFIGSDVSDEDANVEQPKLPSSVYVEEDWVLS